MQPLTSVPPSRCRAFPDPCLRTRAVKSHKASRLVARGSIGLEHRTIFVKRGEFAGQLVKIIAEKIRTVFLRHGLQRQPEIQQMFRQRDFFRCRQFDVGCSDVPPMFGCFRLPKDAFDSRVGILQVRRGVALQREHLVPTENVIALAVRQQVGIFHRAQTDDARDFAPLRLRQIRIFVGNNFEGALLRLVEQVGQLHRLAAAGFERLAILAENRAEPDVGQFDESRVESRGSSAISGMRQKFAGSAIVAGRR